MVFVLFHRKYLKQFVRETTMLYISTSQGNRTKRLDKKEVKCDVKVNYELGVDIGRYIEIYTAYSGKG